MLVDCPLRIESRGFALRGPWAARGRQPGALCLSPLSAAAAGYELGMSVTRRALR